MDKVLGFRCVECLKELEPSESLYVCPSCKGNLDIIYDYKSVSGYFNKKRLLSDTEKSIWRYLDILPIKSASYAPPVHVGWTPLYSSRNIGRELGLKYLFIKDDGRNPSASFKDRAGVVAIAKAMERGEKLVTGASTGNAASSMACLASALGLKTVIFVPATAPVAKIAQLLVFGATVIAVKGSYDNAFDLCLEASARYGWYNRNTGYNPYTREGKKTCSFEIIEQLGYRCPDWVFVPVGDGNIISGIWKGFKDFYELGIIDKLPKLVAVQAERSDAVKRAYDSDGVIRPVSGDTAADSISVSLPRDGRAAVKAIKESKGMALSVTDKDILDTIPHLARTEGVFAEPAGATATAGLKKAVKLGLVSPDELIVTLVTGNGLKDVASAMKAVGKPFEVAPSKGALAQLIKEIGLA